MKRLFLLILLALLLGVWLAINIERDDSYVLISVASYTIETRLWVMIAAVLLTIAVGVFSIWLVSRLLRRGVAATRWLALRRFRSSQRQTTQGMIDFIEGNFSSARKLLSRAAEKSETHCSTI